MATINTIKIRRSASTATPSTIAAGELAYSESSTKLFYGAIAGSNAYQVIGGKLYTDMLDHTAGTLTASSAIIADANSKVDVFKSGNITVTGSSDTIATGSGALTIAPAGNLIITHGGTLDLDAQANSLTIKDNEAAALDINEGGTSYLKFVTTNSGEKILASKAFEFDGAVQIDGALDINSTTDFGNGAMTNVNIDSGAIDGTAIGANSASTLAATTTTITGAATFGVDDTGGDVKMFGATSGRFMLWDESRDALALTDNAKIEIGTGVDLKIYHDGTDSFISNSQGALKIATADSGIAVQICHTTSETTVNDNLTVTGTLAVTSTSTMSDDVTLTGANYNVTWDKSRDALVFPDSAKVEIGAGTDMTMYHDGTNSYITNATGAMKIATETSGVAVTIGHTTSETTIADNLTTTGDTSVGGALGVTGATTVAAITASGTATLNGNVVLGNGGSDTQTTTGVTTHTGQYNIDSLRLDGAEISTESSNTDITLDPHGTGTVVVPSGYKDRSGFGSTSLATKEYVDAVKTGLDPKDSAVMATTANLSYTYANGTAGVGATLTNGSNGAVTIDGIATATANQRVLVKDQSDAEENGIYYVSTVSGSGTTLVLTRATDADTATELNGGAHIWIEQGSTNADSGWVCTNDSAITMGTTDIAFAQFSGAGQITAGDALTKSGNTMHWADDNITLEVSSDTARIKGITTTAVGDLLIGAASDAGYTRLAKAAANNSFLTMGTSGSASWTTEIDGGTF